MGRHPWELYWCETDDHDEDWFVVARNEDDAERFHANAEGYDEHDAWAELVCVLPPDEQRRADEKQGAHWPSEDTLRACGGELLWSVPQDGETVVRAMMGSECRVVRFGDRVYGEGDLVGNLLLRLGRVPVA